MRQRSIKSWVCATFRGSFVRCYAISDFLRDFWLLFVCLGCCVSRRSFGRKSLCRFETALILWVYFACLKSFMALTKDDAWVQSVAGFEYDFWKGNHLLVPLNSSVTLSHCGPQTRYIFLKFLRTLRLKRSTLLAGSQRVCFAWVFLLRFNPSNRIRVRVLRIYRAITSLVTAFITYASRESHLSRQE